MFWSKSLSKIIHSILVFSVLCLFVSSNHREFINSCSDKINSHQSNFESKSDVSSVKHSHSTKDCASCADCRIGACVHNFVMSQKEPQVSFLVTQDSFNQIAFHFLYKSHISEGPLRPPIV